MLVKIGEEVISNAVFAAGTSVSIVISSAVAIFVSGLSGSPQLGAIVGFVVFSGGFGVSAGPRKGADFTQNILAGQLQKGAVIGRKQEWKERAGTGSGKGMIDI